jgi:hypothetical protein
MQALSLSVEREVADSNHYLTGVIAFTSAAPVATTYNLPFIAFRGFTTTQSHDHHLVIVVAIINLILLSLELSSLH